MKEFPLSPLPYVEGREAQKGFLGIAGDIEATSRHVRRHILTCSEEYFYETGHKNLTCFFEEEKSVVIPFDLGFSVAEYRGQIVLGVRPGEKPQSLCVYCNTIHCKQTEQGVFPWFIPTHGVDSYMPSEPHLEILQK